MSCKHYYVVSFKVLQYCNSLHNDPRDHLTKHNLEDQNDQDLITILQIEWLTINALYLFAFISIDTCQAKITKVVK